MTEQHVWELGPGTARYKKYKLEIVNICFIGEESGEPLVWAWVMDPETIDKLWAASGGKRADFTLTPMDEEIDSTLTFFDADITAGPHNGESMAEYFIRPHPNHTGRVWRINPKRRKIRRKRKK